MMIVTVLGIDLTLLGEGMHAQWKLILDYRKGILLKCKEIYSASLLVYAS